jgi:ADP-heptose:LPS heptosyltransferase
MKFNPIQKIYIIATTGALGDTVSTFPTLKLLVDRGHIEKIFVDGRFYALYQLFFPQEVLVPLSEASIFIPKEEITSDIPKENIDPTTGGTTIFDYPVNPNLPIIKTLRNFPTSIHTHLVDHFSMSICDAMFKEHQKDYPLIDPGKLPINKMLGRKYVVIAYGATTEHRRMLPEVLAGLVDYFSSRNIEVVLIGKRDHALRCSSTITNPTFDAIPEGVINFIDQTTMPEALAIIRESEMVIGLDNGLIHMAALTDVPIVAGYTTVDPYYRLPYRHGVKGWNIYTVEPDSNCRYCQTETFCTYALNFLKCQTRTKECMNSLTLNSWLCKIKLVGSQSETIFKRSQTWLFRRF